MRQQTITTPSPADVLRQEASGLLRSLLVASKLQVSVTEPCVLVVSGQVETLRERYEVEQRLAGLPGVTAIDVSRVGLVPFYVVEPGDTLWSLADRLLGDSHQWQALAGANDLKPPYTISPGDRLRIP
jgi:nucleoid-associated protein YgaU